MEIIDQLEVIENDNRRSVPSIRRRSCSQAVYSVQGVFCCYLLETNRLEFTGDSEQLWDYVKNYTPGALYRVARYHRKKHGQPVLGYGQPIFHIKEDTLNDYKARGAFENESERTANGS